MVTQRNGQKPRVVIVGAGFGGLNAARALRRAPVDILLIDRNNYHTFQPLLYQVATAALEPEQIAHAVRGIYHRQENFGFRLATVVGADWEMKRLLVAEGDPIPYDYLILAAGATTNDYGVPGVREYSFPVKCLTDAINLRSHIIRQFELVATNPSLIDGGALNFVIVGGGPTGVEMAGALTELIKNVLRKDFPTVDVLRSRVILLEMTSFLLAPFDERLRKYTLRTLERRGVEVHLNSSVIRAEPDRVFLNDGSIIPTNTLMWAAGVRANPMADLLGVAQDRSGRIVVEPDLRLPGLPDVFVVGDLAASRDEDGRLHPQLAPVAISGAKHAARQIMRILAGKETKRFVYRDKGIMATIGRNAAVTQLPIGLKLKGFLAWLAWLFLHLMQLVGFRNRLAVLVNWAWNYVTYDRAARMIIDVDPHATDFQYARAIRADGKDLSDEWSRGFESAGDAGSDQRVVFEKGDVGP